MYMYMYIYIHIYIYILFVYVGLIRDPVLWFRRSVSCTRSGAPTADLRTIFLRPSRITTAESLLTLYPPRYLITLTPLYTNLFNSILLRRWGSFTRSGARSADSRTIFRRPSRITTRASTPRCWGRAGS